MQLGATEMAHLQQLPLSVLKIAQATIGPSTSTASLAAITSLVVLDLFGVSLYHGDQEVGVIYKRRKCSLLPCPIDKPGSAFADMRRACLPHFTARGNARATNGSYWLTAAF